MAAKCCHAKFLFATAAIAFLAAARTFAQNADQPPANTTNSSETAFVEIKPGSFLIGTASSERDPWFGDWAQQHKVTLTRAFLMACTDVTVAQFREFVSDSRYKTEAEKSGVGGGWSARGWPDSVKGASWRNPGFVQAEDHPVVNVSWNDAMAFIDWRSAKDGKRYRLPTEAEWEYCCRAGSQTTYPRGNNPDNGQGVANCWDIPANKAFPESGKFFNWSDGYIFTSPVGKFKPNAWGLFDMMGNVRNWSSDHFEFFNEREVTDPQGPIADDEFHNRVVKGGSWWDPPINCHCARRVAYQAKDADNIVGFRLALDVDEKKK